MTYVCFVKLCIYTNYMYCKYTHSHVHSKNYSRGCPHTHNGIDSHSRMAQKIMSLVKYKKTVCMYFSKKRKDLTHSGVFLGGQELELVNEFKYLGVTLDSTLTFKSHIKKIQRTIKFNLSNFKLIRPSLTTVSARVFMHAMVFSYIEYGFTNWSFTSKAALTQTDSLYKRPLKILDKKPVSYHHCHILQKYNLLTFDNFTKFKYACAIYKILKGLAPPPMSAYVKQNGNISYTTRATTRGDCVIPLRRTSCGQSVLSFAGSHIWNSTPSMIRGCYTYATFKTNLKKWLKSTQICNHS